MTPQKFTAYAPRIVSKHLHDFLKEKPGLLASKDIEYLHRMRVASRRLNNSLWSFKAFIPGKTYKTMIKNVRKVTKSLGEARDLDTFIFFLGKTRKTDALISELKDKRRKMQEQVKRSIERFERTGSARILAEQLKKMDEQGAPLARLKPYAAKKTLKRLAEFLYYSKYASHFKKREKLHRLRIAAKHLRYTLEDYAQLFPGEVGVYIKEAHRLQDYLGDMHNYHVWGGYSRQIKDKCEAASYESYRSFKKAWQEQDKKELWLGLTKLMSKTGN